MRRLAHVAIGFGLACILLIIGGLAGGLVAALLKSQGAPAWVGTLAAIGTGFALGVPLLYAWSLLFEMLTGNELPW